MERLPIHRLERTALAGGPREWLFRFQTGGATSPEPVAPEPGEAGQPDAPRPDRPGKLSESSDLARFLLYRPDEQDPS